MKRRAIRISAGVVLVVLGCAIGCSEPRSDTGYTGTWVLRTDRIESRIAIVPREDGGYRFRLSQTTADGKSKIRCDWNGDCEQHVEGVLAARFRFVPKVDPATGLLRVRCEGGPDGPESPTIVYENELVVADGGLELESYTIERAGQSFEGDARPWRLLSKFSDRVEDPPARPR